MIALVVVAPLVSGRLGSSPGDGGPNFTGLVYVFFGAIAAAVLGIIGSLICFFGEGNDPSPADFRAWVWARRINYPLGFLGVIGLVALIYEMAVIAYYQALQRRL